jgi:hypothetical protein
MLKKELTYHQITDMDRDPRDDRGKGNVVSFL